MAIQDFKVIQGHENRPTRIFGSVERRQWKKILYNNVGLISEGAEDIASESPENRLQGTPANICIILILPETRVIGLHLCCHNMHLSSFTFFCGGLRSTHVF